MTPSGHAGLLWLKKLSVAILILAALIAPDLFAGVLGETWRPSGEFVRLLAPLYLMQFVTVPVMEIFYLLERQGAQAWREVLRFISVTVPLLLAIKIGASAEQAVLYLSVCGSVSYVFGCSMAWRILRQWCASSGQDMTLREYASHDLPNQKEGRSRILFVVLSCGIRPDPSNSETHSGAVLVSVRRRRGLP